MNKKIIFYIIDCLFNSGLVIIGWVLAIPTFLKIIFTFAIGLVAIGLFCFFESETEKKKIISVSVIMFGSAMFVILCFLGFLVIIIKIRASALQSVLH